MKKYFIFSYLSKTIDSNDQHENDEASFIYSRYIAESELQNLEARMREEGMLFDEEKRRKSLISRKALLDNSCISATKKSVKSNSGASEGMSSYDL